jgi:hypothetical protein
MSTTATTTAAQQIDAILVPITTGARADAIEYFRREFGPIWGGRRVHWRFVGSDALLTAEGVGVHRYYPTTHPSAGADRFEWRDRGDGVMFGVLRPETTAAPAV